MPIEIKVLKQSGKVPAGTYAARYLNSKEYGFLQPLSPCKEAQIIYGAHSGEILPYSAYVETGQLPAQAELLRVKEKLINDLTAAGQKITENARKIGLLQENNAVLEDNITALEVRKTRLAKRVDSLEKRNVELHEELSLLLQQIERSVDEHKVKLPGDVVRAIENLRGVANFSNFGIIHFIDRTEELKNQFYIDNFNVLRKFTMLDTRKYLGGCEVLLRALVNGYTADSSQQQNYESPF
ncbi:hypothetical protein [Paenibacillus sp. P46E]|uniref:hypothetical protein n=1 Tax=Paenibacillus sp. P46E TaxID=1349436 RepID=UPI00093E40BB|nr:hypothetical protein [Paenibacillus sp. P46E]OKP97746.1 hypothetical protein A3849_13650 [Paenibacillus sp. P46E]